MSLIYKFLKGACKEDRGNLTSLVSSDKSRGNGNNQKHRRLHLNVSEHYFTVGMTALVQSAQVSCGVSVLCYIQKLSGRGPGQAMIGGSA